MINLRIPCGFWKNLLRTFQTFIISGTTGGKLNQCSNSCRVKCLLGYFRISSKGQEINSRSFHLGPVYFSYYIIMYVCFVCLYICVSFMCLVPMKARRTQNWKSREVKVDLGIIREAFGDEFDQEVLN